MDASVKVSSRTPVKYNTTINKSNKTSGITKNESQAEDKKIFKSLNEIAETKAKEKFIMLNSKST